MEYDWSSKLWSEPRESFFREHRITPLHQVGSRCVVTSLAMLTGSAPEEFDGKVNTQDPVAWSRALVPFGMKLAYCPTDARRVKFYLPDLLTLDDLFTVSWYTRSPEILRDPDENGWVTGSHIVVLHRGTIFDPARGAAIPALEHTGIACHTKRIFRVVPADHARGL